MTRLLAALMVVVLIAGCATDRSAGNTTETENVLTALVDSFLPDWNRPAARATVATLRLSEEDIDFSRTDSLGRDLSVERMDGTPLPFDIKVWDRRDRIGRLMIRLDSSLVAPNQRIRLRWGLPLRLPVDPRSLWKAIPDSQRLAVNSILVDDFNDGDLLSSLPDHAKWFTFHSESASVSEPAIVPAERGRSGKAIHASYSATSYRYSIIAVNLPGHRSLRALDSVSFWVRGSGQVTFAFDHIDDDANVKAWKRWPMDSTWKRISFTPADLEPGAPDSLGGNIGWNGIRDSVTKLTFLLVDGTDIWLDDIRLYGVDRDDVR